jgi:hypothetical protein
MLHFKHGYEYLFDNEQDNIAALHNCSQIDIHGAYAAFLGAAFFCVALGFLGAAAFFGLVALGFVAVLKVGVGMSERRYEQS